MTTAHTDAQLVAGHLAGDPSALAGIYDRYADSLHDTAAAMLNDRTESADVLQDVILIAAERLGQLRDPERLKPWLFAILRNEVYRRTKKRRRTVVTDFSGGDDGYDMADDRHLDPGDDVTDQTAGDDLAALVRGAARGLDERDQLVLELSVRQGLEGQDLADALGVSANQSYTLVHRMRARVERSLGAFVVAKANRKDCSDLDKILGAWDGEFTVLIRKRVARHIDNCEICDTHRGRVAPLAMFAGAPVFAAPPSLRDRVLDAAAMRSAAPTTPYGFTAEGGFPKMNRAARRVGAWVAPTAAASLVLVAALFGFLWLDRSDDPDVFRAAVLETLPTTVAPATTPLPETTTIVTTTTVPATTSTAPTTTVSATTTIPTTTVVSTTAPPAPPPIVRPPSAPANPAPTPTPAPPTPTPTPTPTAAPTTAAPATTATTTLAPASTSPPTTALPTTTTTQPPAPGRISVSSGSIDLGATATSGSVTVANTGGQPITFAVGGPAAPFTVSPLSGTLAPGQSQQVTASLDRSAIPEGPVAGNVQISAGGESFPVDLRATVERPPTIRGGSPGTTCNSTDVNFFSQPTIVDESGVSSASLSMSGPLGQKSTAVTRPNGTWYGGLSFPYGPNYDPNAADGVWSWTITATDTRGNPGSASGTITVDC